MHARGDLVQYLESQGFYVKDTENTEDIRAAASVHAQAVAMSRSSLFRDVMTNAERILRRATINMVNGPTETDTLFQDFDDDDDVF